MSTVVKWVKEHAKTVAVFIFGVLYNLIMSLVRNELPWPTTWAQAGQLLLTTFGVAIAAWLLPNKISDQQIDRDPTVVRVEPSVGSATINVNTNAGDVARDIDQRIRQQQQARTYW